MGNVKKIKLLNELINKQVQSRLVSMKYLSALMSWIIAMHMLTCGLDEDVQSGLMFAVMAHSIGTPS